MDDESVPLVSTRPQLEPNIRRRNIDTGNSSVQRRSSHQPTWAKRVQTVDIFTKVDDKQFNDVQQFTTAGGISNFTR